MPSIVSLIFFPRHVVCVLLLRHEGYIYYIPHIECVLQICSSAVPQPGHGWEAQCSLEVEWAPDTALVTDRHKRLAQLQQSSKRSPHYQTLERDLIELQEQQLFELFVVVSLQKKASGMEYMPRVIQQFPSKVGTR